MSGRRGGCVPARTGTLSLCTMRWKVILMVAWVVVQLQSAEVHADEELSTSFDTATTAKQGLPARAVSGGGMADAPRVDVPLELAQIAKGKGDATERAGAMAMKGLIAKKLPAMAAAASAAKNSRLGKKAAEKKAKAKAAKAKEQEAKLQKAAEKQAKEAMNKAKDRLKKRDAERRKKRKQKLKKRKESMKKKRAKCGFWEDKEKKDFVKRDSCFKLYDNSKMKADKAAKVLSTAAKRLQDQSKKEKTIK